MKKSVILPIILAVCAAAAVLTLRTQYSGVGSLSSDGFAIHGIISGTALYSGDVVDGIYISIPDGFEPEDVISVSSDPQIAVFALDRDSIDDDRVMKAELRALSIGICELYVRSADGSIVSEKYTVNVIAMDNDTAAPAETGATELPEGITVYITPTGTKYHLSHNCAGKSGEPISLEEAVSQDYLPCKTCAMSK